MLIIGLIGSLASGKHIVADILHKQYDFLPLEYQDFTEKNEHTAKECLVQTKKIWPKNVVIIGIDSLAAMIELSDNPQFLGIAIQGPLLIRWQRRKHSSIDSLETFVRIDDYLQYSVQSNEEDLNKILKRFRWNHRNRSPLNECMDRCEYHIINNTNNRQDLEIKLNRLLSNEKKDQQLTTTELLCSNWDQYFLMLAWITASHGNCLRHRVGCIIADVDQRIIATGYNGTPENIKACNQGGCQRCWNVSIEHGERLDECICIHGEESALLEAGRRQCRNSTLYVTHNPCRQCSKKIVQSGIKRVVYIREYSASLFDVQQLFKQANIQLIQEKLESIPLLRFNRNK